jgi:CBS domain-containing protein
MPDADHEAMGHDGMSMAAETLSRRRLRQLPVVDGTGRVVGMITRADVVRAFGSAGLGALTT